MIVDAFFNGSMNKLNIHVLLATPLLFLNGLNIPKFVCDIQCYEGYDGICSISNGDVAGSNQSHIMAPNLPKENTRKARVLSHLIR